MIIKIITDIVFPCYLIDIPSFLLNYYSKLFFFSYNLFIYWLQCLRFFFCLLNNELMVMSHLKPSPDGAEVLQNPDRHYTTFFFLEIQRIIFYKIKYITCLHTLVSCDGQTVAACLHESFPNLFDSVFLARHSLPQHQLSCEAVKRNRDRRKMWWERKKIQLMHNWYIKRQKISHCSVCMLNSISAS